MAPFFQKYGLYTAFAIALAAMLGSLYASEIAGLQPCILCWYQRILMYPLVLIIGIGIMRKERALHQYVLPFSVTGATVALYQTLLYFHVIAERLAPCKTGVSCTQTLPTFLGFFNVITLSLIAFISITILMLINRTAYHE